MGVDQNPIKKFVSQKAIGMRRKWVCDSRVSHKH